MRVTSVNGPSRSKRHPAEGMVRALGGAVGRIGEDPAVSQITGRSRVALRARRSMPTFPQGTGGRSSPLMRRFDEGSLLAAFPLYCVPLPTHGGNDADVCGTVCVRDRIHRCGRSVIYSRILDRVPVIPGVPSAPDVASLEWAPWQSTKNLRRSHLRRFARSARRRCSLIVMVWSPPRCPIRN